MLTLGIESSCDETSVAVVEDGRKILSNAIASQHDTHSKHGGIVPELASRKHIENIGAVTEEALHKAKVELADIDLVAVTSGPGLAVALLVGLSFAKGLAYTLKIPLVGINHMEGHILAIFLEHPEIKFPFVTLLVSGGHTDLYLVKDFGDYKFLGGTRDDAAGEALDKGARMLGLNYPGGPEIQKYAAQATRKEVDFPRIYLDKESLDFSFSGLKTSLKNYIKKEGLEGIPEIAAGYQSAIVDVLTRKALMAAEKTGAKTILIAGGVAANRSLREKMGEAGKKKGIEVLHPSPILCTDNAAMIASAGYRRFVKNPNAYNNFLSLDIDPRMQL